MIEDTERTSPDLLTEVRALRDEVRGERTRDLIPFPKCGRYSLVGVDRDPATDDRRSRR